MYILPFRKRLGFGDRKSAACDIERYPHLTLGAWSQENQGKGFLNVMSLSLSNELLTAKESLSFKSIVCRLDN